MRSGGGVWRAAEPVHRVPRPGHARHKPRGALGPTLPWPLPPSPPAKRAGRGPDERDVLGRKPRLPEVRTPRPVRLQAAAPRAWPQRPWPAWPAGDGSGAHGVPRETGLFTLPSNGQCRRENKTGKAKPGASPAVTARGGALAARPAQTGADKRVSFVRTTNLEASGSVSSVSARPSLAGRSRPQLPGALLLRIRK